MAKFFHEHLAVVFGLLGNFISFMVYLAPMVTFCDIYKRRSTQNYDAFPYSVALFSSMLMLYYAHLKGKSGHLLLSINSFGCAIEAAYLITFLTFANSRTRKATAQLILVFNVGVYISLIMLTFKFSPLHHQKVKVVGWICAAFSVCVYAAPLSVMRRVIKTKSVKSMPFPLSFCLTLSAVIWFCYGMFSHDYFVATPNVLGFLFGIAQIILYFIYRKGPERDAEQLGMRNWVTTMDETSLHDVLMVAKEIIEYDENMKNRKDNNDDGEESTPQEPELSNRDELNINGNNATVPNQLHLNAEDEIVEILDVDQGVPLN